MEFGSFSAMEKRVHREVFKGFGMSKHGKHCKNQCLGPVLCQKRVNDCVFEGKTL